MSNANNHYQSRCNARKSTSKRRILNVKKSNKGKFNNSSSPITPISERIVIGAENSSYIENTRKDIFNFKNDADHEDKQIHDFSENVRTEGDGNETNDGEAEELSKLRCASVCTEVIAERENNRRQRCADYPGLAFGFSIFSSDTLMKFSVIRNELHNILNSQLKRTESEVASLSQRIRSLEERLEESEEQLLNTSCKLAEASQKATECEQFQHEIENRDDLENYRVGIIENHMSKARLIAEQADEKYEEVLINLAQNMGLEKFTSPVLNGDIK